MTTTTFNHDEAVRLVRRLRRRGVVTPDALFDALNRRYPNKARDEAADLVKAISEANARSRDGLSQLDDYNAILLVDALGSRFRYVPPVKKGLGTWYAWDGNRWRPDEGGIEIMEAVNEVARQVHRRGREEDEDKDVTGYGKGGRSKQAARRLSTAAGKSAALRCAEPDFALFTEALDKRPDLLALGYGTLELRGSKKGTVHDPRPEDFITRGIEVNYVEDASDAVWCAFLASIFPDEPEKARYLDETIAWYGLHGHAGKGTAKFLVGGTDAGKSTLVRAVVGFMGSCGSAGRLSAFYPKDGGVGQHDAYAACFGPRIMYLSEGTERRALDSGSWKNYLGGVPTTYQPKWGHETEAMPTALLLLDTNETPALEGADEAALNRAEVIEARRRFFKKSEADLYEAAKERGENPGWADPDMEARLASRAAREGMLRHFVEVLRGMDGPPIAPPSVVAATDEWRASANPFASFISTGFDRVQDAEVVPLIETHEAYLTYVARNHPHATPLSLKRFVLELRRTYGCETYRAKGGEHRDHRMIRGLVPKS